MLKGHSNTYFSSHSFLLVEIYNGAIKVIRDPQIKKNVLENA